MRTYNSPEPILDAVPNAGTVISEPVDSRFTLGATCQASFSDAAAAGTLKLQGSNDWVNPTRWNDIANTSAVVAGGVTTMTPAITATLCYQWIRVVFASSGGAGTITANLHTFGE